MFFSGGCYAGVDYDCSGSRLSPVGLDVSNSEFLSVIF